MEKTLLKMMQTQQETLNEILGVQKELLKRFDRMEKRFDRMEERFDRIEGKFDRIDERFDSIEKRLDRIETKVDQNSFDIKTVFEHFHTSFVTKKEFDATIKANNLKFI